MNPEVWAGRRCAGVLVLCAAGLLICCASTVAAGEEPGRTHILDGAIAPAFAGAFGDLLAAPAKGGTNPEKTGQRNGEPAKGDNKPPSEPDKPPGEPAKGEEAGGGSQERVVVDIEQAEFEPWRLPEGYKNPDGSYKEDVLVAQQKKRLDFMNKKLAARFQMVETAHYLIFSDADSALTGAFTKMCEALYSNLGRQFSIESNERIWDGKCILLLFSGRSLFLDYARVFDGHDAAHAGAYFAWESNSPKLPQLVHICIPVDSRNVRRLQELFAHEGTHAFFQLYKKPVMLPLWLHEGLAEFMTVVNDPSLKSKKQEWAIYYARRGAPIREILECQAGLMGFQYPAYNISYTLVDFLVAASRSKFRKFIDLLKAGKSQDEALKAAYGFDLESLEERWQVYVKDYLAKGR